MGTDFEVTMNEYLPPARSMRIFLCSFHNCRLHRAHLRRLPLLCLRLSGNAPALHEHRYLRSLAPSSPEHLAEAFRERYHPSAHKPALRL